MKFTKLGLLALAALTATAFAATQGLSITRQPKEKEESRYKLTADVDFGGMAVKAIGTMRETVTKVEADGTFRVEQATIEMKINVGGQEQDSPSSPATTTVYAPDGTVKEIIGSDVTADAYRMATLNTIFDQRKPLAINDTWTYEFKANPKTGVVAAKGEYKIVAEEKVLGVDTIKVKATVKETEGTDPASSDGFTWINKADGTVVRSEAKWVSVPLPGAPAPINATVVIERLASK